MELPIDHFRLLGVSPSSTTEEVLRFFRLRLDRPPEEGFTPELMAQRSELLRRSADLLCDKESREKYETALLGGALGLEFSSNREVAGLILLWEAGISYEAFKLARKALQPPQAPALGSGRESDLTLLASLSCRDAALQEQEQRYYSSSAELLEEGIQLLQRMGKLPEQRQNLEQELEALLPYRILDLLSRDLSDQKSHQMGIDLLDGFVLKRGGLEGKKLTNSSSELKQVDFEIFFQQIRKFLTVQEQIDLFYHWYKNGSSDAGFLCVIALVASGFYRRKPEALQKAKKQINKLNLQGLDSMSLLGCINLLLADVHRAEESFKNSPDVNLKEWLDTYPGDKLAAFCDYTRNWLLRDVLPGFRDVDVETVDLEAWFADRDVQEYIEKIERKGTLGIARAGFSFISGLSPEKSQSTVSLEKDFNDSSLFEDDSFKSDSDSEEIIGEEANRIMAIKKFYGNYRNFINNLKLPIINNSDIRKLIKRNEKPVVNFIFLSLILAGGFVAWVGIRNQPQEKKLEDSLVIQENGLSSEKNEAKETITEIEVPLTNKSRLKFQSLSSEKPSQEELLTLIEAWLEAKADILSGVENTNLPKVARPALVNIVNEQREKDQELGEKQIVNTEILSLKIQEQTSKRIEIKVSIAYQDKRIKESGDLVSETSIPSLGVNYILGRKKGLWKLIDFSSGT